MRIVGGALRGLTLAEPGAGDPAAHLRPTTDRVREAMFNLLTNGRQGDLVRGARVLDLFAGTGALGIEALSRGADHATFVDNGTVARGLIRDNIQRARMMGPRTQVMRRDATALGPRQGAGFSLVLLDPPYGAGLGARALEAALAGGWLAPGAHVMAEDDAPTPPPPGFELLDSRAYGQSHLTLMMAL